MLVSVSLRTQIAIVVVAFAAAVGVAELAGAVNLGTAFGVGQFAVAATCVALVLRA
jgi:hypothetical protein